MEPTEKQVFENEEEGEGARPAAYARILARMPKYLSRAMDIARPLAYASEIGESFRKVFPNLVKPMYALSIGYVIGDISVKSYLVKHKDREYRKWYALDLTLWHLFASLILPALTINRWVHYTTKLLGKTNLSTRAVSLLPTISALCLIPFIIHPLDHFTDWLMDNSFRRYVDYTEYDNEPFIIKPEH